MSDSLRPQLSAPLRCGWHRRAVNSASDLVDLEKHRLGEPAAGRSLAPGPRIVAKLEKRLLCRLLVTLLSSEFENVAPRIPFSLDDDRLREWHDQYSLAWPMVMTRLVIFGSLGSSERKRRSVS